MIFILFFRCYPVVAAAAKRFDFFLNCYSVKALVEMHLSQQFVLSWCIENLLDGFHQHPHFLSFNYKLCHINCIIKISFMLTITNEQPLKKVSYQEKCNFNIWRRWRGGYFVFDNKEKYTWKNITCLHLVSLTFWSDKWDSTICFLSPIQRSSLPSDFVCFAFENSIDLLVGFPPLTYGFFVDL